MELGLIGKLLVIFFLIFLLGEVSALKKIIKISPERSFIPLGKFSLTGSPRIRAKVLLPLRTELTHIISLGIISYEEKNWVNASKAISCNQKLELGSGESLVAVPLSAALSHWFSLSQSSSVLYFVAHNCYNHYIASVFNLETEIETEGLSEIPMSDDEISQVIQPPSRNIRKNIKENHYGEIKSAPEISRTQKLKDQISYLLSSQSNLALVVLLLYIIGLTIFIIQYNTARDFFFIFFSVFLIISIIIQIIGHIYYMYSENFPMAPNYQKGSSLASFTEFFTIFHCIFIFYLIPLSSISQLAFAGIIMIIIYVLDYKMGNSYIGVVLKILVAMELYVSFRIGRQHLAKVFLPFQSFHNGAMICGILIIGYSLIENIDGIIFKLVVERMRKFEDLWQAIVIICCLNIPMLYEIMLWTKGANILSTIIPSPKTKGKRIDFF